jgi:hypothetical protein
MIRSELIMRACAQKQNPEQKTEVLQRRTTSPAEPVAVPATMNDVLGSPGRPLEPGSRSFMETRFGHDFSRVRVHTNAKAAESTQTLNALAYTVGRDVVFARQQYRPVTASGRQLLAHELTHVVQQGGTSRQSSSDMTPVLEPTESVAEQEADRVASEVVSRGSVATGDSTVGESGAAAIQVTSRVSPRIQRTIRARVVSQLEADARNAAVCMVHLHPNEENALEVARDLRATHCANLVFVEDTSSRRTPNRLIQVEVTVNNATETCNVNANRIFSEAGRDPDSGGAISGCSPDARAAAASEVETFVNDKLGPKISNCRGGSGSADMSGPLPVVAFHNNSNTAGATAAALRAGSLNIYSYQPAPPGGQAGVYAAEAEQDPNVLGGRTNPAIQTTGPARDPDDFLLVTRIEDFDQFRGQRNVVLQAGSPTDDGSLSVVLSSERYINIESGGKAYRGHGHARYATNRAMALEVFQHLQVPERPCIGAREGDIQSRRSQQERAAFRNWINALELIERWAENWRGGPLEQRAERRANEYRDQALRGVIQQMDAIQAAASAELQALRASIAGVTLPCPSPAPAGVLVFCNTREIDTRKRLWARRIDDMDPQTVVEWIVGQVNCRNFASRLRSIRRSTSYLTSAQRDQVVMCEAFEEARQQIDGLRAAMPDASARGTRDPLRTFATQQNIWELKYRFHSSRGTFGAITQEAQDACVADIGGDATQQAQLRSDVFPLGGEWDTLSGPQHPHHARHQHCWENVLTPDQRQREILQTSSAPGTSRHHWGTDVDLGSHPDSLTNEIWETGQYAGAYQWLQQNAIVYGMIQPYTAGRSGGYQEERWHWSYYPVAQALVEATQANEPAVESRLGTLWDQRRQAMIGAGQISQQEDPYSYVRSHWREFVYQVQQRAASP